MLPNLIKNSILKSSALLKSQQYQLYYSICIKIALLKYLYFPFFLFKYFSMLFFIMFLYYMVLVYCGGALMLASLKCQFSIPTILGRKLDILRRPIMSAPPILKGTLPFLKQEMSLFKIFKEWVPNPNLFESPPSLFIFSRTDSKLQSTLLHQRFICY